MRLAIVRSSSSIISFASYNCQEIGLAKSLTPYGVSTDVYMAGLSKKAIINEIVKDDKICVRVIQLPFISLPGQQAVMIGLLSRLINGRYDIVQVHEDSQITSAVIALILKFCKTKTVLCQGMYLNYSGRYKKVLQAIYDITFGRLLIKTVDSCIAKTQLAKKYLVGKGYKQDIFVCNIGLDTEPLLNATEPLIDLDRYNIPEGAKILLYVGKVEKRRNIDFLIKLLVMVRESHNVCLMIVGSGPELNNCKKLAEDLCVEKYVIFAGLLNQRELSLLYKSSFCFLLPSSYEIYGMVMLESMFFGLPVISSITAGAIDVITDKIDGLIISELTISKWADGINELLDSDEIMLRMKYLAKQKIENKLIWKFASETFYRAYTNTLTLSVD